MSAPNVTRLTGAVLGIGLAVALLLVTRPEAASMPLAASLRVEVPATGELEVTPAPPRAVLDAPALRPGGPRADGSFLVRNQTGKSLDVALTADADSTALNGLLRVRARIGERALANTTLEGLVLRTIRLSLASGQRVQLRLEAWLPSTVLSGYAGVQVEVSLTPAVLGAGGP